jgi:hypothetical protein
MERTNEKSNTSDMNEYLLQLTEKERRAYEIAKSHLQTSFDLEKSIGFKKYMKNKQNKV